MIHTLPRYFICNQLKRLDLLPLLIGFCVLAGCAPRVVQMFPTEGRPGSVVSLSMEYLVGWPRVEIGNEMMDWPKLTLLATDPARQDVRGEDLVWIEDKVLQFKIPNLQPGEYTGNYPRRQRPARRSRLCVLGNHRLSRFPTGVAVCHALEPDRGKTPRFTGAIGRRSANQSSGTISNVLLGRADWEKSAGKRD